MLVKKPEVAIRDLLFERPKEGIPPSLESVVILISAVDFCGDLKHRQPRPPRNRKGFERFQVCSLTSAARASICSSVLGLSA